MTYFVSITGHGASADDAIEVFENTVRALRKINSEGDGPMISGTISGTDNTGNSFAANVTDVQDLEEYETEEVEVDADEEDDDDDVSEPSSDG